MRFKFTAFLEQHNLKKTQKKCVSIEDFQYNSRKISTFTCLEDQVERERLTDTAERESPEIDESRRRRLLMENEAAILFRKRFDSVRFIKNQIQSLVIWLSSVWILWFGSVWLLKPLVRDGERFICSSDGVSWRGQRW